MKNVEAIERLYKNRFSHIYHLMPFYKGDKLNVISVYDSSFYFQGYIAQGFKSFFKKEYEHYFFVADDLVLNPIINESNYKEYLQLKENTCFIPDFISLHAPNKYWKRAVEGYWWDINVVGVEANGQLPTYGEALQRFKKFGLSIAPTNSKILSIPLKSCFKKIISKRDLNSCIDFLKSCLKWIFPEKYYLNYPIIGSYSDVFVISSNSIKQFCHLCGTFAATKLFVELAIPTSVVLSAEDISTEANLELRGRSLWTSDDFEVLDKYNHSLTDLLSSFPTNYLYLHPIKLSKWVN
ncbi:MAG TPA: hypothetical protein VLC98_01625 [Phnomibacter sp.]|nr:hypothetical protein [Phnomibacter sp.]